MVEHWHVVYAHTLRYTHTHTHAQCEPALLFLRSGLSHWGVSHLSCPITADTAVKLSNKSVSQSSSAPPADRLTGCLTGWLLVFPTAKFAIRPEIPEEAWTWSERSQEEGSRNMAVDDSEVSCSTLLGCPTYSSPASLPLRATGEYSHPSPSKGVFRPKWREYFPYVLLLKRPLLMQRTRLIMGLLHSLKVVTASLGDQHLPMSAVLFAFFVEDPKVSFV